MKYYVQNSVLFRLTNNDMEVEFWNPSQLNWENDLEVDDEVLGKTVDPVCGLVCCQIKRRTADRIVINAANRVLRPLKQLELCHAIATEDHMGQTDKAGEDYINHPIKVASFCKNYVSKCVAMLHDVIEDCGETVDSLIEKGVHPFIAERVLLVSKEEGEHYKDYLDIVAIDAIACEVKLADLRHNLDLSRLKTITAEDRVRAERYQNTFDFLTLSQILKYSEQLERKYTEPRLLQGLGRYEAIDDSGYVPTSLYSLIWYKRVKDILPWYDK